ncbi:MAG TPA: hypothetical protein VFV27_10055 [Nevskiaceae bacterium]|nr:hypothetical protein [Nevskiaceae bacterium]
MNPNPDQKARQTQAAPLGEDVPAHKKQRARRIFFTYLGVVTVLWWVRVAAGNEPDALVLISFYLAWMVWQGWVTGSIEVVEGSLEKSVYPSAHKFWLIAFGFLSVLTAGISLS